MSEYLSRADFAAARKEDVYSIELKSGKKVFCCGLSGKDTAKLNVMSNGSDDPIFQMGLWPFFSMCNQEGERLYKDEQYEQLLEEMPVKLIAEISKLIVARIQSTNEVEKEAKNLEISGQESIENSSGNSVLSEAIEVQTSS